MQISVTVIIFLMVFLSFYIYSFLQFLLHVGLNQENTRIVKDKIHLSSKKPSTFKYMLLIAK